MTKRKTRQAKNGTKRSKKTSSKRQKDTQAGTWINRALRFLPAWLFLGFILILFTVNTMGGTITIPGINSGDDDAGIDTSEYGGLYNPEAPLAPLFTESVDYWAPAIYRWAAEHDLNPNLIATVIQIESCGHPYVQSFAGAQGPFQVMPLHFGEGENQLDINANAEAGLNHLKDCLFWSGDTDLDGVAEQQPDVGLALVCYNGGPAVIYRDRSTWVQESRLYYTWGTGIWADASKGRSESSTLDAWLRASESQNLCNQAEAAQTLLDPLTNVQ